MQSARQGKCRDEAFESLRLPEAEPGVERSPPLQFLALLGCRLLSHVSKGTR